ncbi:hypothetical protein PHYBOEH_000138 [Phytophthora boehmeriae]|uniref:Endo-beta-1,6-galactanase-like domain-containing protein n=1 Tax=Phytophthora boehmeriae TaxID=109152 RepID=A0A8T1X716_9STRA|nr:hypothetical protein PHYBOEH_000138 [Phytophthora boehmeriae]
MLFTNKSSVNLGESTEGLPALGFNVARYNIGGSGSNVIDDSGTEIAMKTSESMPAFKTIETFWLDWINKDPTSTSWNWSLDAKQRAMLKLASDRGVDVLEAYSNSPPWWMTNNLATAGGDDGTADNLQASYKESFALYLATVVSEAKKNWGVNFAYVSPFNEASSRAWKFPESQEACHVSIATQSEISTLLRKQLDTLGLQDVLISGAEEKNPETSLYTLTTMIQDGLSGYDSIRKFNVHGSDGLTPYAGTGRDKLFGLSSQQKLIWDSQYADEDATGLTLAENIARDINEMRATAFVYRQAFDSGVVGLIQSNPWDNWIGTANAKYYVMAHYSRHIRPGMIILNPPLQDPLTVVAYDKAAKVLVLVASNPGEAQTNTINLEDVSYVYGPVNAWTTETADGGVRYKTSSYDISFGVSTRFTVDFPAASIMTFEIHGAELTATVTL